MVLKRLHWLLALVLIIGPAASLCWAAEGKVGFINLQRLVNESKMGQAARENIKQLRQQRQNQLKTKLEEINALRTEVNEKREEMSLKERQDKIEVLQKAYKEYQRMVDDAKEDITREDKELVALILQKADGILKNVAKSNGYSIIIKDPNVLGYLDPGLDITDLVLKALDKKK
jgi:outer membrane protein